MKVTTQQLATGRFVIIIDGGTEMTLIVDSKGTASAGLDKIIEQHDADMVRRQKRIETMIEASNILKAEGK